MGSIQNEAIFLLLMAEFPILWRFILFLQLVQGDSEQATPEKDVFNTSLPSDADKQRWRLNKE